MNCHVESLQKEEVLGGWVGLKKFFANMDLEKNIMGWPLQVHYCWNYNF